jgi:hypothetical protein
MRDQFKRPDDQAMPYHAECWRCSIGCWRQQVIGREGPLTRDRRHEAHVPRIAKIGSLLSWNPRQVVSNACCPTADKSQDVAF